MGGGPAAGAGKPHRQTARCRLSRRALQPRRATFERGVGPSFLGERQPWSSRRLPAGRSAGHVARQRRPRDSRLCVSARVPTAGEPCPLCAGPVQRGTLSCADPRTASRPPCLVRASGRHHGLHRQGRRGDQATHTDAQAVVRRPQLNAFGKALEAGTEHGTGPQHRVARLDPHEARVLRQQHLPPAPHQAHL